MQIIENILGINKKKSDNRIISVLKVVVVFAICSMLWIFFRAKSFGDAWYVVTNMFEGISNITTYIHGYKQIGIENIMMLLIVLEFILLVIHDYFSLKYDVIEKISGLKPVVRWALYIIFMIMVAQLSFKGDTVEFIYADF